MSTVVVVVVASPSGRKSPIAHLTVEVVAVLGVVLALEDDSPTRRKRRR